MSKLIRSGFLIVIFLIIAFSAPAQVHLRINQVGYLPEDQKTAIAFSNQRLNRSFSLINQEGEQVYKGKAQPYQQDHWGAFNNYYYLDFSDLKHEGTYRLIVSGDTSRYIKISNELYYTIHEDLLIFMRQQRCGYNPFLDLVCHKRDGKSFFGVLPDSTFLDASGGWHDAGDQLKYLMTSSFATAAMLKAYQLRPELFADSVNDLGQPFANQIPDVLDEAKWGLDWIHKLHPSPGQLYHQIADDRDHRGWKWPDQDVSDYGWGENSYRPVYYATGETQGLNIYKSEANGIANLAGRSAAALALGYQVLSKFDSEEPYAEKSLQAAIDLYEAGREKEGYQQGNSFGAPYRYMESTWADDMEWAAAELYLATGQQEYLEQAKSYAEQIGSTSWMILDSAAHYEYYPFINLGHFVLYPLVEDEFKEKLAGYYRQGIEYVLQKSKKELYGIGIPMIWCSNNLMTALISQIRLYEMMTGDTRYRNLLVQHRDWLLGRNPWGTSMFMNIPADGEYPQDVHTSVWKLTGREVPGGLVDGPIWKTIHSQLKGLLLTQLDEFKEFQNDYLVYHDDIGDYATNEPTMDGTAGAILMMVLLNY